MKYTENLKIKRNVLLNPGPATTTDSVKMSQVVPDICPREKEFGDCMEFIVEELTNIVANSNEYTTVLFGGSGTAAVEAVLSSVITGKKIFVINNGSYSTRMCEILKTYNADFINYKNDLISTLNYTELENEIIKYGKIDYLSVVHNETGTGLLNDIERIGSICKKHNIEMIVDAMSTYAALPIDMKKMNISFLAASSNKNIQGMAGVGFVICSRASLDKLKDVTPKSFYLDLYSQYAYFTKTKQTRFTPPVQTLYALKQAIIEAKEETIAGRYKRYTESYETIIKWVKKLGLKLLLKDEDQSKIITAIYEPENAKYDFNKMHDYLYENGYTIYPGKVSTYNTFRIANIGAIDKTDFEKFFVLLEKYLETIR